MVGASQTLCHWQVALFLPSLARPISSLAGGAHTFFSRFSSGDRFAAALPCTDHDTHRPTGALMQNARLCDRCRICAEQPREQQPSIRPMLACGLHQQHLVSLIRDVNCVMQESICASRVMYRASRIL